MDSIAGGAIRRRHAVIAVIRNRDERLPSKQGCPAHPTGYNSTCPDSRLSSNSSTSFIIPYTPPGQTGRGAGRVLTAEARSGRCYPGSLMRPAQHIYIRGAKSGNPLHDDESSQASQSLQGRGAIELAHTCKSQFLECCFTWMLPWGSPVTDPSYIHSPYERNVVAAAAVDVGDTWAAGSRRQLLDV